MLLSCQREGFGASSLQIYLCLVDHPDFQQVMAAVWGEVSPPGDAMHVLCSKLKHLRQRLRIWNHKQFGLVHERVNGAE